MSESALVALIPEAEYLVGEFRRRFDPSAALGVPAHVTVLYPFMAPGAIDASGLSVLEQLFSQAPAFDAEFDDIAHFPRVLFLAPFRPEPFRHLTQRIVERYPETPPYRGAFTEIHPHLTIAQLDDADQLSAVETSFRRAAIGKLPIRSRVEAVVLMDDANGRWKVRRHFRLKSTSG